MLLLDRLRACGQTLMWAAFWLGLMCSGCAEVTKPTPTVSEIEEAQLATAQRYPFKTWSLERVSRVFLRELATLPQVHGRTYPFLGFNWWVTETDQLVIDNVWKPSPADDAGLKQGDLLLAVNNWPIFPQVKKWDTAIRTTRDISQDLLWGAPRMRYGQRQRREQFFLLALPGELLVALMLDAKHVAMEARGRYLTGPVDLTVQRAGDKFNVTLYPQHLPAEFAILVDTNDRSLNAFAAPGRVILTRRIVNFCLNDDELALIVGHELAHHAYGHLVRGAGYQRLGGLAGKMWRLVGAFATGSLHALTNLRRSMWTQDYVPGVAQDAVVSAFSREDEREADLYGLWYAYQAGYNLERGLLVYERLAAISKDPFESTYFLDSHPTPLERLARLKKTAGYFKAGRAAEVFLQTAGLNRKPSPKQGDF